MKIVSGVNENLKVGRNALEAFNKTFPKVESFSMAQLKAIRTTDPQTKREILGQCSELYSRLEALRKEVYGKPYSSFLEYINALKQSIKKYNVADCGNRTDVIIGSLKIDGRTAQKVEMVVFDSTGKQKSNHIFPVMAMKKSADMNNLETWGENAIIIDAWANIVMKSKEGVNYLKKLIGFAPQKEQIKFNLISDFDIKNDIKNKC